MLTISLQVNKSRKTFPSIDFYESHLGLSNAKSLKQLRMFDGQFDDLFDFFDLFVEPSNHLIRGVRHLLHHHQTHQWVHLQHKRKHSTSRQVFKSQKHLITQSHKVTCGIGYYKNHITLKFGRLLNSSAKFQSSW